MTDQDERTAFLARFAAAAGDLSSPEQAEAAYELVKGGARELGASANWQAACDWVTANYEEATELRRRKWVIREGSTLLVIAST
ncbi:hypothetical protein [Streptomyces sp. NPDC058872]|uniref:hypothetical protein n=1 Tax=Streptomyces sp. NPDC058872 TaxID=3346661 RepID=UPI0036C06BE0